MNIEKKNVLDNSVSSCVVYLENNFYKKGKMRRNKLLCVCCPLRRQLQSWQSTKKHNRGRVVRRQRDGVTNGGAAVGY